MAPKRDMIDLAAARFGELADACSTVRAASEAAVTTWEWATGPLYDPAPLGLERSGMKRGRRLVAAPAKLAGAYHYGLDERRRVRIVRELLGPDRAYEELFTYDDGGFERVRLDYTPEKPLIGVTVYEVERGRVVRAAAHAREGSSTEAYAYRGERPVCIAVSQRPHGGPESTFEVKAEYDELGVLRSVQNVFPNGYARTVFQRPATKHAVASLTALVRERLVELVPEVVGRLALDEPAYAVVLAFDAEEGGALPPLVGVGLASERAAWVREHGPAAREYVWNPAEYRHFDEPALTLDEPELLAACRLLGEQLASRGAPAKSARKLLDEAAAALNGAPWAAHLSTTDDFVVFATDLESADVRKSLRASAPADRIAMLARKGLL